MIKTHKYKNKYYLIPGLDSFCGLTWGDVKIDETGTKSDDLNSCPFCAESKGFGVAIGDRLLKKSKTGVSCRCET
jgi:hypothetical protein